MADNFIVRDGDGDPVTLASAESAGIHTPRHAVASFPGTVEADVGFIKTFLNTLQAIVTANRAAVNVDSVTTGKLDSIITALGSHLATLAGSVSASRVAVDLTTTVTSNIATLVTHLATLAGAVSSGLMQTLVPDVTASGTLGALDATVQIAVAGRRQVAWSWTSSASGNLTPEISFDGGTTWQATLFYVHGATTPSTSTSLSASSGTFGNLIVPAAATHARVRMSTYSSGSIVGTIRASAAGDLKFTQQLPTTLGQKSTAQSLSVTLSSDSPLVSDVSASGTLNASNAAATATMSAHASAGMYITSGGNLVGTLTAEYSIVSGAWETGAFIDPATGASSATLAVSSPGNTYRILYTPPGTYQVRVRVSSYTSGSSTGFITNSNAVFDPAVTFLGPASPKMDQVGSIGTSADVQFSTQVLVKGMAIKNISTSGQLLYLKHSATPTSSNSLVLQPGEWSNDIECTNANQVYMRASAAGGAACYSGR